MSADPRSRAQRRRDTEHRLTHDIDLWVASASADGAPYLVPLSFDWEGEALLVATPTDSPTGRNLAAADLDGTFARLQASGAEVVQEPTEQPYGVRDCAFRDPAGNMMRIQER